MKNNRKGYLTMELLTALAILVTAVLPMMTLQLAAARHAQRLRHNALVGEMMGDRLAILRKGGWKAYGLCERREIKVLGKVAGELPDNGRLLLSVTADGAVPFLLNIVLYWEQPDARGVQTLERKTHVFAPEWNDTVPAPDH